MHHGIGTAIASDFLNRRRNRKEFPQREANLAIFYRKTHRNHNRIVTAKKNRLLESGQACAHHLQLFNVGGLTMKPSKNRCVQFRPRERIADFDRKSSPGDGALRVKQVRLVGRCVRFVSLSECLHLEVGDGSLELPLHLAFAILVPATNIARGENRVTWLCECLLLLLTRE